MTCWTDNTGTYNSTSMNAAIAPVDAGMEALGGDGTDGMSWGCLARIVPPPSGEVGFREALLLLGSGFAVQAGFHAPPESTVLGSCLAGAGRRVSDLIAKDLRGGRFASPARSAKPSRNALKCKSMSGMVCVSGESKPGHICECVG